MDADRIVVGIDGSEGSLDALRWAVDEARRRHAAIEVVYAWHQAWVAPTHILGDPDYFAGGVANEVPPEARAIACNLTVTSGTLATGNPAHGLIHETKGAALLVVGSRGRGGFTGLLLGSVSPQGARHSRCPVVIIPSLH